MRLGRSGTPTGRGRPAAHLGLRRRFVWGANARGQLGCGDRTDRAVPTLVEDDVLYNTHLALDAPADGNRKSLGTTVPAGGS